MRLPGGARTNHFGSLVLDSMFLKVVEVESKAKQKGYKCLFLGTMPLPCAVSCVLEAFAFVEDHLICLAPRGG